MVERSGVPVNGVDPNWLQHQYQMQQQPALVAHMIRAGQAPGMNAQPIMGYGRPRRSGCSSPFFQVVFGIVGFVAIVGGILYGIQYAAQHKIGGLAKNPDIIASTGAPPVPEKTLRDKGLDPKAYYPYWPLVYDQNSMVANKETISGKVTNYGEKPVSNIMIQFGLFSQTKDKIGTAEDQLASLGPGETWSYKAGVKGIDYDQCRVESITFK